MKILIAEDDAVSRHRLEANLHTWGYDVVVAVNGDEAWRSLRVAEAPRLAILDWMMPGMDGLKVCEQVRKLKKEPYIYILILTSRDRKEDIVHGLEAGADDYLTKPYDSHELKARLRAGRRIIALQEALRLAHDALRFQATLDPLTGLWNRTAIHDALKRELVRAEHESTSLAVFIAHLDQFSRLNETHGPMAGDSVLRHTARRIRSACRPYDAVGRLQGEEFIVIVPGCGRAEALEKAERIQASISDKDIDLPEGRVRLSISVGVVTTDDKNGLDSGSLIRAAEAALARAKEMGGNRVKLTAADDIQPVVSARPHGQAV